MPVIRKALLKGAQITRKEARRLVSRKAISGSGDFPGRDSGALFRSIKIIGRGRNWVKVGPSKTAEMGKHFYPAFLSYGVTGKPRRKDHKAQVKDGTWRIAPRANYMTEALSHKRSQVQSIISDALQSALTPIK